MDIPFSKLAHSLKKCNKWNHNILLHVFVTLRAQNYLQFNLGRVNVFGRFTRTSFSRTFPFNLNWISTAVSHDSTNRSPTTGLLVLNRHSTHIIIVYGVMFGCSRTAMPWPRPLLSPKAVPLSRIRPAVTPLLSSSPLDPLIESNPYIQLANYSSHGFHFHFSKEFSINSG